MLDRTEALVFKYSQLIKEYLIVDDNSNFVGATDAKPSKKKTIWLVVVILALIASNTGWALFFFKQQGELNAKISILTVQVAKLKKDNKALQDEVDKAGDAEADSGYREIPELGVKYKLDSDTKDLTYSYNGVKDNETISWSTIKLSNKSTANDGCNSYDGAVMVWSKKASELSDDKGKKVGTQTIYSTAPDGGDSLRPANCQDKTLLDAARAAEKKAYDSLKPI